MATNDSSNKPNNNTNSSNSNNNAKYKKRRRTYPKNNTQDKVIEKSDNTPNRTDANKNNSNKNNPNKSNPNRNNSNPRRKKNYTQNRRWDPNKVKVEETVEDIVKENERIEKEIWLEIAEIHNARID